MKYKIKEECSEDGCTNWIYILKTRLCFNHAYAGYRKNNGETCSLEWCDNQHYAHSMCRSHYLKVRRGSPIVEPGTDKGDCPYELCDRKIQVGGYCKAHYTQLWNGKELAPIRPHRVDPARPGQRSCLECGLWKSEDDFHNGSRPGSKQSRCKPCYNRRIQLHREAKKLAQEGVSME